MEPNLEKKRSLFVNLEPTLFKYLSKDIQYRPLISMVTWCVTWIFYGNGLHIVSLKSFHFFNKLWSNNSKRARKSCNITNWFLITKRRSYWSQKSIKWLIMERLFKSKTNLGCLTVTTGTPLAHAVRFSKRRKRKRVLECYTKMMINRKLPWQCPTPKLKDPMTIQCMWAAKLCTITETKP